MRRREFITLLGGAAAAWPLAEPLGTRAQETGKVYRIGWLSYSSPAVTAPFIDAFRDGLRELGWIEQNVIIEPRFAEGRSDRLPDLAADLVGIKVDIILATTTPALVAAKNATGTIPIVAINVGDPVALGLIASLARPGGNITRLSYSVGADVYGKDLELLKEVLPEHRPCGSPLEPGQSGPRARDTQCEGSGPGVGCGAPTRGRPRSLRVRRRLRGWPKSA